MKSLLLILVGAMVLGASPAAADMRLEVEHLVTANNIGNADIALVACSTASGGFAIDGLDLAGEWLELDLLLTQPSCLYTAVRSAGLIGIVRNFTVEFFPLLPATTAGTDSLVTLPGTGIG